MIFLVTVTTKDALKDRLREAMSLWDRGWGRNDISTALKLGHSTIDKEVKLTKSRDQIERHEYANKLRHAYWKEYAKEHKVSTKTAHKVSLEGLKFRYKPDVTRQIMKEIEREGGTPPFMEALGDD